MAYVLSQPSGSTQGFRRKTRAEEDPVQGSMGGAGNNDLGGEQISQTPDFAKSDFVSGKTLLQKNLGQDMSTAVSRVLNPATREAQGQESQLQTSADVYKDKESKKTNDTYGEFGEENVNKAVGGDAEATAKARDYLYGAVSPVAQFAPERQRRLTEGQNLALGNLTDTLIKGGGPRYNTGLASLDQMLLKKSGALGGLQKQIGGLQSEIDTKAESLGNKDTGVQAQIEKARIDQKNDQAAKIRKVLETIGSGIKGSADKRYTDRRGEIDTELGGQLATKTKEAEELRKGLANPILSRLGGEYEDDAALKAAADSISNFDLNPYLKNSGNNLQLSDLVSGDEASRYNNAMGLLNSTDRLGSTQFGGYGVNLDPNSLKEAILAASKDALGRADSTKQQRIDAAIKEKEALTAAQAKAEQEKAKAAEPAAIVAAQAEAARQNGAAGGGIAPSIPGYMGGSPVDRNATVGGEGRPSGPDRLDPGVNSGPDRPINMRNGRIDELNTAGKTISNFIKSLFW